MPHLESAKYIRRWVDGLHSSQGAETEAFPFEQCLAALKGVGVQTDYDLVIRTDVLPETPPFLHRYIKSIRMAVLEHFASGGQSALDALNSTSGNAGYVDRSPVFIKSGINCLDDLLCGGLRVGQATELCGKSGSGKTQLAIRFAVSHLVSTNAQSSDSKVYYLQTSTLPIWRVEELLRAELGDFGGADNNMSLQRAMERLIVVDCHTHESLLEFLYKYAAETAYSTKNDESTLSTDLVIIDSIRPLIINASDTYNNRYILIHAIKTALRATCAGIQNLRSAAVLITNGISQRGLSESNSYNESHRFSTTNYSTWPFNIQPSLGILWAQTSHTHILLSPENLLLDGGVNTGLSNSQNKVLEADKIGGNSNPQIRATVLKSVYLPAEKTCIFSVLEKTGVN